jgi:hypothetical protein
MSKKGNVTVGRAFNAVNWAVYRAVDRAVETAVGGEVNYVMYRAVDWAVYWAVDKTMYNDAVDWPVREAVYEAEAVYRPIPPHWNSWGGEV